MDEVIKKLEGSDLTKLLRFARDWNTNTKTCQVAQTVLYTVMKLRKVDDVIKAFTDEESETMLTQDSRADKSSYLALRELVDGIIPYTERHLSRMNKFVQESYVVDYILAEMDDGVFDGTDIDSTT